MTTEKQILDAKIQRWERVLKRVQIRLQRLRDLRAQYDVDDEIEDELRELLAVSDDGIDPTKLDQMTNHSRVEQQTASKNDASDDAANETKNEESHEDVHNVSPDDSEIGETEANKSAVRGKRNRTRRMILTLSAKQSLTVPAMKVEMGKRGHHVTTQAITRWVRKLMEEGLLVHEEAKTKTAKHQYRLATREERNVRKSL